MRSQTCSKNTCKAAESVLKYIGSSLKADRLRLQQGEAGTLSLEFSSTCSIPALKGMFLTLSDRILMFLSENPSSTARAIAASIDTSQGSVAAYLSRMFKSRAVTRSEKLPFAYSLPDPSATEAFPSRAPLLPRRETRLADEHLVLAALTEGRTSDRETLLDLLGWTSHRLGETVDRLHSADLVKTVHGSYVLIPRRP